MPLSEAETEDKVRDDTKHEFVRENKTCLVVLVTNWGVAEVELAHDA